MVNSVTPIPNPPIASETIAGAILGDGVFVAGVTGQRCSCACFSKGEWIVAHARGAPHPLSPIDWSGDWTDTGSWRRNT